MAMAINDLKAVLPPKTYDRAASLFSYLTSIAATEPATIKTRGGEITLRPGDLLFSLHDSARVLRCSIPSVWVALNLLLCAGLVVPVRPARAGARSIYHIAAIPTIDPERFSVPKHKHAARRFMNFLEEKAYAQPHIMSVFDKTRTFERGEFITDIPEIQKAIQSSGQVAKALLEIAVENRVIEIVERGAGGLLILRLLNTS